MWVISDNSALSALAEMGLLEVLPRIVGQVTLPAAVASEMRHPGTPDALKAWISSPPSWMLVVPDPVALRALRDLDESPTKVRSRSESDLTREWRQENGDWVCFDLIHVSQFSCLTIPLIITLPEICLPKSKISGFSGPQSSQWFKISGSPQQQSGW